MQRITLHAWKLTEAPKYYLEPWNTEQGNSKVKCPHLDRWQAKINHAVELVRGDRPDLMSRFVIIPLSAFQGQS